MVEIESETDWIPDVEDYNKIALQRVNWDSLEDLQDHLGIEYNARYIDNGELGDAFESLLLGSFLNNV